MLAAVIQALLRIILSYLLSFHKNTLGVNHLFVANKINILRYGYILY